MDAAGLLVGYRCRDGQLVAELGTETFSSTVARWSTRCGRCSGRGPLYRYDLHKEVLLACAADDGWRDRLERLEEAVFGEPSS